MRCVNAPQNQLNQKAKRPTTALASKDESSGVTLNGTVLGSHIVWAMATNPRAMILI